ncbi:hypothetical protein VIBNISFn118_300111 [Vibrio nigripulchritudo SFn118]|nr:hypothetical protein VIBNISFn118_300111 [Vibrio nigripulchritudo SFn118]
MPEIQMSCKAPFMVFSGLREKKATEKIFFVHKLLLWLTILLIVNEN